MASTSVAIDQLLNSLAKSVRGVHQARLDSQTLAALERFFTYLVNIEGLSEGTARVYKSVAAKAVAQGADPNNPVMKSALNALARFRTS